MNCEGCGKPLEDDVVFCPSCGRRAKPIDMPYPGMPGYPDTPGAPNPGAPNPGVPYPSTAQMPYPGMPPTAYRSPGTSGFAIASLVLSLVGGCGIGSVLAIVFGNRAKREIRESRGQLTGEGMATAGIIVGWVGLVGMVLYVLFIFAAASQR